MPALGTALGIPWGIDPGKIDDMKAGTYPPNGGPGTIYLATDSPVLEWVNVAGIWRPVIDGAYLGYAPGDVADWPTNIPGWDGHAMMPAQLPGVPHWTIQSGQSLAVHARARLLGANTGAFAECVLLHEHDTVGGTNTGQDYGCGLAVFEPGTLKAAALALAHTGGSPDRVAILTCANYTTGNWGTTVTPYTEIQGGVRRTGSLVLRAMRTAPSTITFAVSANGITWENVATYGESTPGAASLVGPTLLSTYNGTNPVGLSVLSWRQG